MMYVTRRMMFDLVNNSFDINLPFTATNGRVYFWMDTLCVPLSRLHRKKAILRMAQTYQGARAVIVLDSTLMHASEEEDCATFLTRILFSPWYSRLWTLQEGALTTDLMFICKNTIRDFDELGREYLHRYPQDHFATNGT